jgi:neutral ceramidase
VSPNQHTTESTKIHAGFGRADITAYVHDVGMMGYALPTHRTQGIGAPLHARAMVLQDSKGALTGMVCCDLWGITPSLYDGVIEQLALRDIPIAPSQLLITGTHTHSGPGGYSHHLLFNLSIQGFVPDVFNTIVQGITDALDEGYRHLQPAKLSWAENDAAETDHVAFNRSLRAYNRNPDVEPLTKATAHLGVDRSMVTLRADSLQGERLGSFHWFGVHGCSLHSDAGLIHPDNKGIAATTLEQLARCEWNAPKYVAAFPQTTAGDVTPNFRWNTKRGLLEGLGDTDLESATRNGQLQARQALEGLDRATRTEGPFAGLRQYIDFRHADAQPKYAGGNPRARTGPAVLGVRMISGTEDGSGPPPAWALRPLWWILNRTCGWVKAVKRGIRRLLKLSPKADPQGPKMTFLEVGLGAKGRLFGVIPQKNPPLPEGIDPGLARIKHLHRVGAQGTGGWVPQVLPLQFLRIGSLLLCALPFEPTTQAGRRMRAQIESRVASAGVERVVIVGWANAYGGYLTTFEEYQAQQYEGASTYFGQWTLAATQTALDSMLDRLLDGTTGTLPGPEPDRIPADELTRRTHATR